MKNGTYLSPQSQNELSGITGIWSVPVIFKRSSLTISKESKLYSIMMDEVTVSDSEITSICFRYVDSKKDIQEVFLEFFDVEKISDAIVGMEMLNFHQSKDPPLEDCTGQHYDGALNMQSEKKGMASFMLEKASQASSLYTLQCAQFKFSSSEGCEN